MIRRWFFSSIILSSIMLSACRENQEPLSVYVFSVGYGDSVLIRHPSGVHFMIDAGTIESAEELAEKLRTLGIHTLDALCITHWHDNHYGAISVISEKFKVTRLYIPHGISPPEDAALTIKRMEERGTTVHFLKYGDRLTIGRKAKVTVLHPKELTNDVNKDSTVLMLQFHKSVFLFPADIPASVQSELTRSGVFPKQISAVLLPHHGTELDENFAHLVRDSLKLVSWAPSKWGTKEPPAALKFTSGIYRTDQLGDILVQSNGEDVFIGRCGSVP